MHFIFAMSKASRSSSPTLTKADLTAALRHLHDAIRAESRQQTRDIIGYVRKGFDRVDDGLTELDTKVSALMESPPVTRQELHSLIRELRDSGIKVDESRIFSRPQ